ncbi:MAG: tetratricopeptide repeat protein [Vicinamibacterales bacterium]
MGIDNPRIQELRRRIQADPASIAFAQLAEEYRRAGEFDEAAKVCRNGLARYPGYHSARVTLGRALLSMDQLDEARTEFEIVLQGAPDNLAAARGMDEIRVLRGEAPLLPDPLSLPVVRPQAGETLFDLDALLEQLDERSQTAPDPPPAQPEEPRQPEEAVEAVMSSILPAPGDDPAPVQPIDDDSLRALEMSLAAFESARDAPDTDPRKEKVLSELESWLGAIVADRQRRSGT